MPRRSPALTRGVAAVAGLGALVGGLLATGAATPVVEDVVSLAPGATPAATAPAGGTVDGQRVAGVADHSDTGWMRDDGRAEWSGDRMVPKGPTGSDRAQLPANPSAPRIQVPENPKGRQFFQEPATRMREYKLQPRSSCFQQRGPEMPVRTFSATPGKGQVTLSWWDLGDPDTVSYQIDVVSVSDGGSDRRAVTVKAPNTCKTMTVTITGLRSGAGYGFWLVATNRAPEQGGKPYRTGRGQSPTVAVL
jgi:hypothetical protein